MKHSTVRAVIMLASTVAPLAFGIGRAAAAVEPMTDLLRKLPAEVVSVSAVDDLPAAVLWREQHSGKGIAEFKSRFHLPDSLDGLTAAARVTAKSKSGDGATEALVMLAVDDAAGEAIARLIVGKPTTERLTPLPGADGHAGIRFLARSGRTIVLASSRSLADRLAKPAGADAHRSAAAIAGLERRLRSDSAGRSVITAWWGVVEGLAGPGVKSAQLDRHGLDAIRHLAAVSSLRESGRTYSLGAVRVNSPLRGSLVVAKLNACDEIKCPTWLAAAGDRVSILSTELPRAMRSFGPLFDDLFASGIYGTYDDVLIDTKDPAGLDTDLPSELFDKLGSRCVLVDDSSAPDEDARVLVALEIAPGEADVVADVVQRLMQDDPEVARVTLSKGAPPLWRYPDAADRWAGVAVVENWLCYAANDRLIRTAYARMQEGGSDSAITFSPPKQLGALAKFGAASRETNVKPAAQTSPLDAFFEAAPPLDEMSSSSNGPNPATLILNKLRFADGESWAGHGDSGWLILTLGHTYPSKGKRDQ